jgi:hypothetical protein
MQQYNTQMPQVKLPEYGRNLQELVSYCKTIPDREKRTRYAYGIVSIMGDLYPDADKVENLNEILWDHLALISNYELDIDYPVEIIPKDKLNDRPETLKNPQQQSIRWRMYGKTIEEMVEKACAMEDQEQRIRLFELCANHMKLHFHITHPSADEDDDKIIHDLIEYAHEQYKEDIYKVFLYSAKELQENTQYDSANLVVTPTKKKKKKKKKSSTGQQN